MEPAKEYCLRHLDKGGGYRILADIYGGIGSLCTESNQFHGAFDAFREQWKYLQKGFEEKELERPSIWEVHGLGRLGNGYHGLHRYQEAESYYRQCLEAWKELPGDQKIFRSHLATCLWLQGRLDEAEDVVKEIIKDENDTSNFRSVTLLLVRTLVINKTVHRTAMAMYCFGNIKIAQAKTLTQNGEKDKAEAKLTEAMTIHVKVFRLWTITLGARHHKTADAMHKLGWHLHRRKEYTQAL